MSNPQQPDDEAYIVPEPRSWDEVIIVDNDETMTFAQMQAFVGGLMESVGLPDGRYAYVNEEGLDMDSLPVNHVISAMVGRYIFGPAIIINERTEEDD
jgi:hypothetical protein